MRLVVPGVELLHRQIIHPHELHAERREILSAIRREIRVVLVKVPLLDESRVARADGNSQRAG